jgi:hypothetical protein
MGVLPGLLWISLLDHQTRALFFQGSTELALSLDEV